jgi:hypothetical protein
MDFCERVDGEIQDRGVMDCSPCCLHATILRPFILLRSTRLTFAPGLWVKCSRGILVHLPHSCVPAPVASRPWFTHAPFRGHHSLRCLPFHVCTKHRILGPRE